MEWLMGIVTLVSILAGAYSVYSTNKQNKELAELQNQWNEQAATTAYERGIEQWNRETDYGLQMSKLESAGINPALAYSSGVSMPSFSAVTPAHGVSPAKMQAMDFSGLASGAQSIAQYNLQKDLNEAQVENLKADAALKKSEIPVKEQEVQNLIQQVDESKARCELITHQISNLDQQSMTEIATRSKIEFDKLMQQRQWAQQSKLIYYQIKNVQADTNLKNKQAALASIDEKVAKRTLWEMVKTYNQRFAGLVYDNQLSEQEIVRGLANFHKLGIDYSVGEDGRVSIQVDPHGRFGLESSDVYNTIESLLSLVGIILTGSVNYTHASVSSPKSVKSAPVGFKVK